MVKKCCCYLIEPVSREMPGTDTCVECMWHVTWKGFVVMLQIFGQEDE